MSPPYQTSASIALIFVQEGARYSVNAGPYLGGLLKLVQMSDVY